MNENVESKTSHTRNFEMNPYVIFDHPWTDDDDNMITENLSIKVSQFVAIDPRDESETDGKTKKRI